MRLPRMPGPNEPPTAHHSGGREGRGKERDQQPWGAPKPRKSPHEPDGDRQSPSSPARSAPPASATSSSTVCARRTTANRIPLSPGAYP